MGFNSASLSSTINTTSSQCLNKIQSSNLAKTAQSNQLNCDDFSNYNCELRVFKENIQNEVNSEPTCILINAQEVCIPTTIHHYNTSNARHIANTDEAEFREGAEYNRQEANCNYYDARIKLNLIRAEAETIPDAINSVLEKCSQAKKLKE